ncbi:D-cysteine desulfhydrase [Escherichia coli]|uniref:D-cysteine desulfhydrase n=1 Tax=Escherichia coli TaxID=562 RepID=A0A485JGQ0_ECOLX|nr:D-cysteine desulfhydrase [Escherichia coli]
MLDLFNTQIEMCDALTDPNAQLEELATRVEAQGFRPYVIPVGGSNALGALVMWRVRWKLRNSVKGQLIFRRWWSRRAVPELTPDWLLGWNT